MSLILPNDKIVYTLPEQVGINAKNIKYLAEVYKEIDSIPAQFADIKAYYEDTMVPTFSDWTTTFEGWTTTLDTYLANMSSAALGAIAGGTVPGNLSINGDFTANSIIENMNGYSAVKLNAGYFNRYDINYCGIVKNGNKITFAVSGVINIKQSFKDLGGGELIQFNVPASIGQKLFPITFAGILNILSFGVINFAINQTSYTTSPFRFQKENNQIAKFIVLTTGLSIETDYYFRFEQTFLLSDNLIP